MTEPVTVTSGHVWLDGRLVTAAEARIDVTDRGFQLGDGVFETLRARRGRPIEWPEHLDRLLASAAAMSIALPADGETLRRAITDLLTADGLVTDGTTADGPVLGAPIGDAAIRITVTRGPLARRGLLPAGWEDAEATIAIQAWPYVPPPAELLERGLRAIMSTIRREPGGPLAGVKSTSRADHVYAKLEADRAGADEALFLTTDGRLSEATSANLFLVRGDLLVTPSAASAVLVGTTRNWLLGADALTDLGLQAGEADLRPADLGAADEAFLSSSVAGIVPLTAIGDLAIGTGRPGDRTIALRSAREDWIDDQSRVVDPDGTLQG